MLFLTNMYNFLLQNTKEDILKEHWGPKHGTPLAFIVWTDRQKFLQVCTKMRVSKFLGQLPLCGIVELEKKTCAIIVLNVFIQVANYKHVYKI